MRTFPLARMSALLWAVTVPLLALPVLFVVLGLTVPGPAAGVLRACASLMLLTYAAIWLIGRPTRFEVGPDDLVIVWPIRRRAIPRREIASIRTVTGSELRQRCGFGMRVGAGGLWGGFGWLWTTRCGLLEMYVSRTDDLVLVERRSARALLITPERPDEFVRALGAG